MTTPRLVARVTAAVLMSVPAAIAAQVDKVAPANAPATVALTQTGERGTPLRISGVVVSGAERTPVPGASIYVYQTDAGGVYNPNDPRDNDHPRLHGYLRTDRLGRYTFTTIRPGSYPNTRNPGHIHYEIVAEGYRDRIFEIVFEGDTLIPEIWRRDAGNDQAVVAIIQVERAGEGLRGTHDVVLRPR